MKRAGQHRAFIQKAVFCGFVLLPLADVGRAEPLPTVPAGAYYFPVCNAIVDWQYARAPGGTGLTEINATPFITFDGKLEHNPAFSISVRLNTVTQPPASGQIPAVLKYDNGNNTTSLTMDLPPERIQNFLTGAGSAYLVSILLEDPNGEMTIANVKSLGIEYRNTPSACPR